MKLTIRLVIACACAAAWHAAASAQSADRNDAIFLYRGADREQRLLERARREGTVVAYNTQQVRREELPRSYDGFTDPKWKGRIGIEATDAEWMATLVKLWGEQAGLAYFRKLAAMEPDVRKGHILLAELIGAGEIAVGLTGYNSNAESLKRKGAPIDRVPVDPVVARAQGIGLGRNAPR